MILSNKSLALLNSMRRENEKRWPHLTQQARPASSISPPAIQDPTAIELGTSGDQTISLPFRVRQRHTLVVGSTEAGKSRFNFLYCIEAIRLGEGVLFIDPHGTHPNSTAKQLLEWLDRGGYYKTRKITYIDFSSDNNIIGFNPLFCPPDITPTVIVKKVMKAVSIVWNEEDTTKTPTIVRVLMASLLALTRMGMTLAELPILLDHDDRWGLRARALQDFSDSFIRGELERIHKLSLDGRRNRDYDIDIVGPINRLAAFLYSKALRTALGQTTNTFDALRAMENGEIIIANTSENNNISDDEGELFARLLVREFLFYGFRRTGSLPFNIVPDEASRVFSSDLPIALAGLRKYNVAIMASIQWMSQALDHSESVHDALLNGCVNKVVFRTPGADESELFARSIVPMDLERPVDKLIGKQVTGHRRIKLASESDSTNQSVTLSEAVAHQETWGHASTNAETYSHTEATSEGVSDMQSHSSMQGAMDGAMTAVSAASMHGSAESIGQSVQVGDGIIHDDSVSPRESHGHGDSEGNVSGSASGKSHGRSNSSGDSHGTSRSTVRTSADSYGTMHAETESYAKSIAYTKGVANAKGTGHTLGYSEGLEPILEDRPTAVHSLQNMIHKAAEKLRSLKTGSCFISFLDKDGPVAAILHVTPMLTPPVNQANFPALRDRVMAGSNGAVPMDKAIKAIEERHQQLKDAVPKPQPKTPVANTNTKPKKVVNEKAGKRLW